ncbi:MAG: fibronectin type III domain-containing protein [Thermoplasmata archaeon]|nr:MAG: fibronectin type III domain-containing protein [Thermoplasmata archaeon]
MKTQHILFYGITMAIIGLLSGCSSSTDNSKIDVTPPPVPSDLTITKIGNGSVSLSWQQVSDKGLKGYNIFWMAGTEVDTLRANRRFVTTNFTIISGLEYNTLYYFAVSSIDNNNNESALSFQEKGIPHNTEYPSAPTGVDVVAESINESPKITVFWAQNTEPDFVAYNVYRSLTSTGLEDSSSSFVTSLKQENYIDTDVNIGITYYYRITALDRGGLESNPSVIVSDLVLPRVELISPVDFAYVSANPTFTWERVPGASKYNIIIKTSRIGGEIWNIEIDAVDTHITYNGKTKLSNGEIYYWMVGAISRRVINSTSADGTFIVKIR